MNERPFVIVFSASNFSLFVCIIDYCITTCYSLFEHYKRLHWRVVVQKLIVKNQLSAKLWPTLLPLSWEANIKMSLRKRNKMSLRKRNKRRQKFNQDQRKKVRFSGFLFFWKLENFLLLSRVSSFRISQEDEVIISFSCASWRCCHTRVLRVETISSSSDDKNLVELMSKHLIIKALTFFTLFLSNNLCSYRSWYLLSHRRQ